MHRTNDVYISNKPYNDDNYKYSRDAINEIKHSDRIYFNSLNDDMQTMKDIVISTSNEVTEGADQLLKGFVTENGDNVKAYINFFNQDLGYYIEPFNSEKAGKILSITPNDARRIKEILTNNEFAVDMIYSNDVCSPSRGRIDFTHFYFNVRNKTVSEQVEENTVIQNQIKKLAEENKYDITVSGERGFINVTPNTDISFEKMYDIAKNIDVNFENLVIEHISDAAATGEKFGGIDLMNAVDGDSNCDEQMDMSDVVLIMQSLANPNKYQLSEQGSFNADLDGNGITVGDAQAIQEKLLGIN